MTPRHSPGALSQTASSPPGTGSDVADDELGDLVALRDVGVSKHLVQKLHKERKLRQRAEAKVAELEDSLNVLREQNDTLSEHTSVISAATSARSSVIVPPGINRIHLAILYANPLVFKGKQGGRRTLLPVEMLSVAKEKVSPAKLDSRRARHFLHMNTHLPPATHPGHAARGRQGHSNMHQGRYDRFSAPAAG